LGLLCILEQEKLRDVRDNIEKLRQPLAEASTKAAACPSDKEAVSVCVVLFTGLS
jgi:hypothetical protein